MPEFSRHVLEVLRQPIEEGCVRIARAARTARLPRAVHARRGDESMPLRIFRRPGPGLPMHAAADRAIRLAPVRAAARSARPHGAGCGDAGARACRRRRRGTVRSDSGACRGGSRAADAARRRAELPAARPCAQARNRTRRRCAKDVCRRFDPVVADRPGPRPGAAGRQNHCRPCVRRPNWRRPCRRGAPVQGRGLAVVESHVLKKQSLPTKRTTIGFAIPHRTGCPSVFPSALPVVAVGACAITLPLLVGLGARWSAQATLSELQTNALLRSKTPAIAKPPASSRRRSPRCRPPSTTSASRARSIPARVAPSIACRSGSGRARWAAASLVRRCSAARFPDQRVRRDARPAGRHRTRASRRVRTGVERRQALAAATPSMWPVAGWITSGFGNRRDPFTGGRDFHPGLDISAEPRRRSLRPRRRRRRERRRNGSYGNLVIIDHGFGIITRYGHLSRYARRRAASRCAAARHRLRRFDRPLHQPAPALRSSGQRAAHQSASPPRGAIICTPSHRSAPRSTLPSTPSLLQSLDTLTPFSLECWSTPSSRKSSARRTSAS